MQLLIIDDEEHILEALDLILRSEGYEVVAFSSAQMVWEKLSSGELASPAIIMSDIVMPDMSGLELLEHLRARPDYENLPVVLMSASIAPSQEEEVSQLPGVYYLRKPFRVDKLLSTVKQILNSSRMP